MKLLVIIVTYNAIQWIDKCLRSIVNSSVSADIFIVDNGSADGTQKYVKEHFPKVIFQQSETNLGFGMANNIGLQYAIDNNFDYVYLLNQDAWVFHNTFELLINISENNPQFGILSPMQMQANRHYMDNNFVRNVCFQIDRNEFICDLYCKSLKNIYEVHGVMAAHWLISQQCLKLVGGFSPSFPHYGEDDNWASRAIFWGFKIGIVPSAQAVHDRETRQETIQKKIYMFYIEQIKNISNPLLKTKYTFLRMIKQCLLLTYQTKKVSPLRYTFKFLMNIRTFKKNKQISIKSKMAFLESCSEYKN